MTSLYSKHNQTKDGGPSQLKQSGRKGKKAWRKNIDLQDVSHGLEQLRQEERLTGGPFHKKPDSELFHIDLTGDENVRKALPRPKPQLTSTKILSERSAVPAVFSRAPKRKMLVTKEDKERLSRIGKRGRKGPFNSVMDPTEMGAGSALLELSEAVKSSGRYDVWTVGAQASSSSDAGADGFQVQGEGNIKAPQHPHPRDEIDAPSVAVPHQGSSYNPIVQAHQALLLEAHTKEEARVKDAEELQAFKDKIGAAASQPDGEAMVAGMIIQSVDEEGYGTEVEGDVIVKPQPARKTKQQRQKAAKQLSEKRALTERLRRKRLLASINDAKSIRKQLLRSRKARQELLERKKIALSLRSKNGLAGQRFGRHKVPEAHIDVQLGEDLSESLRALKPEGNLFRDRFLSMQQRALIEPRVRVISGRRANNLKVYERHSSKRFV